MQSQGGISATVDAKQVYRPGRRPRVPLSCDPCRTRKSVCCTVAIQDKADWPRLRCNRDKPCQNCTARDEETNCIYKGPKNGKTPVAQINHQDETGDLMQQRIEHLECLVKNLIAQQQEIQHNVQPSKVDRSTDDIKEGGIYVMTPESDTSDVVGSSGTTVIDGVYSIYKGADDWHDVLQEIKGLKQVWNQTQDDQPDYDAHSALSNTVDGSSLLFAHVKPIEMTEILATLPSKPEVDKLIHKFFDRETFPIRVVPILHEPTFIREYNEHWRDPSRTNIIWLGLIFSILGITMLSYHQYHEPPEYEGISESLFQLYRLRTAQCLLIGDIAKCLPYTLETLRFNATAELNRKDDNGRGLWMMTGVMIRAAINMGYHRDPSQLSSITILQAEYRRRVWLSIISMDDMASFLVGFPRTMPAAYSDTMEPRNLHDWELLNEITVLPPSRPLTESTPATYLIAKGRLLHALGRITDFNNDLRIVSYDTVLELDNCLCEAYQNFPSHLKGYGKENMSSRDNKSPQSNLQLQAMYHRGICALHRKFIVKGRLDPQYNFSRDRCISSALALLSNQAFLELSWYKFAQTRYMLTLAAMILFLELEYRRRGQDGHISHDSNSILAALEKSCQVWKEAKDSCTEALRVYDIIAGMLSSFQTVTDTESSQTQGIESAFEFPGLNPHIQPSDVDSPLEKQLLEMSNEMDIDWATWDAFLEGASFGDGVV